jgi:GST-like protein
MIDFYTWATPNGRKVFLMLEETGIPYRTMWVNIGKGDQFKPEFLAINPNNKIPAIVDHEGPGGKPYKLFESGAILMYLAEKSGKFMPSETGARYQVIQWLMFQMGGIGPMLGQAGHFREKAGDNVEYGVERFTKEAARLYGVVDKRLGEAEYLAGDYSIADMATYPWIQSHRNQGQNLEDFPNLKRWYDAIGARPAMQRTMELMKTVPRTPAAE